MSRTTHHRNQKSTHCGHDYGGRYKCNKSYGCMYGKLGRKRAAKERRFDEKKYLFLVYQSTFILVDGD